MIKGTIRLEDRTVLNLYINYNFKYIKVKMNRIKRRNRQITIIVGEFNNLLSTNNVTSRLLKSVRFM